ncbi:MAG: PIG-L family deacetylase [Acidobacteria bacterium]|nr:PIG-L family deacetylase [Acidobacteriota bacterium]
MNSPVDCPWEALLASAGGTQEPFAPAVLAAHPDDETIGASRLLSRSPRALVIYLTDGAPRDRSFWSPQAQGSREDYAELRRSEARRALARAGISDHQTFWLGGIDQEAILEASLLAARLSQLLATHAVDALVTHAYEGGHPDHDAAALIARMALSRRGGCPQLLEMTSYHARDGRRVTGEFLEFPGERQEIRCELSSQERRRKQGMLKEYVSQTLVLGSFPVVEERIRKAPNYDFSSPPHAGPLWYESLGWPLSGMAWREFAWQALETTWDHLCG